MRFADLLKFSLAALLQQKVRTLLTILGVIIGTFVLFLSLSLGIGVREIIGKQFRNQDRLRQIEVWPAWETPAKVEVPKDQIAVKGRMDPAKRERLRQAIAQRWNRDHSPGPRVMLTDDRLKELGKIEHVRAVVPHIRHRCWAMFNGKAEQVLCGTASMDDRHYRSRVEAGRYFASPHERTALVSEFLLYRMGIVDEEQVRQVLGKKLKIEFREGGGASNSLMFILNPTQTTPLTREQELVLAKAVAQLPDLLVRMKLTDQERATLKALLKSSKPNHSSHQRVVMARTYTITGVLRLPYKADQHNQWSLPSAEEEILLPLETAKELFLSMPAHKQFGFDRVYLLVDQEDQVRAVTEQVNSMGFHHFSLADIIERIRANVLMISLATTFVAAVALLVAALGIVNTMLMTVLERTHEIGVMKAVGARDRHILLIFLVEGAFIGLLGGCLGVLGSWLASFPGDAIGKSVMEKQTQQPLEDSLFAFPLWLTVGIPLFATLVTILAAVLPARRAARINPILALRHE